MPVSASRRVLSRVFVTVLLAFCASARGDQFALRSYLQADGLPNLSVLCLAQDRTGFIWACTENGLFRFNGTAFQRVGAEAGVTDTYVTGFMQSDDGRLWIATEQSLLVGDGRRFSKVTQSGQPIRVPRGLRLAERPGGRIVVALADGLLEVSPSAGGDWNAAKLPLDASAEPGFAFVSADGALWYGCGEELCADDGNGQLRRYAAADGLPPDRYGTALQEPDGSLWFRGPRHVVALLPGGRGFVDRSLPEQAGGTSRYALGMDPGGHVLTHGGNGLASWRGNGWQRLGTEHGIPSVGITAILSDDEGGVWLGSFGRGVLRWLGYGSVRQYTHGQGLASDSVWSILKRRDGTLLIGTEIGAQKLDAKHGRFVAWAPQSPEPLRQLQTMAETRDGALWLGLNTGQLLRLPADGGAAARVAQLPRLKRLFVDARGTLWVVTEHGLWRVVDPAADAAPEAVHPPDSETPSCHDATGDATGRVWFACDDGLRGFDGAGWSRIAASAATGNEGFIAVAADRDGTLWAGGRYLGVYRCHLPEAADTSPACGAGGESLDELLVMFVRLDHHGRLWIGSDRGLYAYAEGRWAHLTDADGLTWNDLNEGAFFAEDTGTVWVGSSGGLSRIDHPERLLNAPRPRVAITSLRYGSERLDGRPGIAVPWSHDPLTVQLAMLRYALASDIGLRYRLVGVDRDWVGTRELSLRYPALQPGRYQFQVMAVDGSSGARSDVVSFSFSLSPPWWRTTAFFAIVVLASLLLAVALWQLREVRLRRRRLALERLVDERTRELQHDKQKLEAARQALFAQATYDSLTGLYNRGAIIDLLDGQFKPRAKGGGHLSIALADIDHFKHINDRLGHFAGDAVLREFAARMRANLRAHDAIGRYGGEEFLILMPDATLREAKISIERLRQAIDAAPVDCEGHEVRVTSSFGLASLSPTDRRAEDLLRRADAALYTAKRDGRDCVRTD